MALVSNTTHVSADDLFSITDDHNHDKTSEVAVAAVLGVFASCDCYPLPNSTPPADSTPTCSQVANTRTSMAPRYSALSIATLLIDSLSLNGSSHSEYHKGQVVHVQSRKVRLLMGYFTLIRQSGPCIVRESGANHHAPSAAIMFFQHEGCFVGKKTFRVVLSPYPRMSPEHLVG